MKASIVAECYSGREGGGAAPPWLDPSQLCDFNGLLVMTPNGVRSTALRGVSSGKSGPPFRTKGPDK